VKEQLIRFARRDVVLLVGKVLGARERTPSEVVIAPEDDPRLAGIGHEDMGALAVEYVGEFVRVVHHVGPQRSCLRCGLTLIPLHFVVAQEVAKLAAVETVEQKDEQITVELERCRKLANQLIDAVNEL